MTILTRVGIEYLFNFYKFGYNDASEQLKWCFIREIRCREECRSYLTLTCSVEDMVGG